MVSREQITAVGDGLLVLAPAKINLSLLVAGKRPDGFHEIETIMAKVDWYDEILIQPGRKAGTELICEGPHWAPAGKDNLVCRAAEMLMDRCHYKADLLITLTKNVPAGSGLGSASSDAAAALMAVKKFLQMRVTEAGAGACGDIDEVSLHELAAELGSDVAFFLDGPLALCTGKGEKIKKIHQNFDFIAMIILPDVSVSTKRVYANYEHDAARYEKLSACINDYVRKNRIDLVVKMCANMLERKCFDLVKSLAKLKGRMESLGIGPCCLSGSGSAMFRVFESGDEERARRYKRKLEEETGCKSIIVRNNRW